MIIYSRKELKKPALWILDRLVITVAIAAVLIRVGNWFNSEIYGGMDNSAFETVFTNPVRESILVNLGDDIESINFELTSDKVVTDSITYPVYTMSFQLINLNANQDKERAEMLLNQTIKRYVNSRKKEDKNIIFPKDSEVVWDNDVQNLAHIKVMGVPRHPTQIYEALGYLLIFLVLYNLYQKGNYAQRKGFIFGVFLILVFGFRFFIEYLKENQISSEEGQLLNTGQYLSIPLVLIGAYITLTAKKYKKG
jgi:prolipoprotein diacylglyceryltransferase